MIMKEKIKKTIETMKERKVFKKILADGQSMLRQIDRQLQTEENTVIVGILEKNRKMAIKTIELATAKLNA